MNSRKLFPCLLVAAVSLFIPAAAIAQSPESDSHQTSTTINAKGSNQFETELAVSPSFEERRLRTVASPIALKKTAAAPTLNLTSRAEKQLLAAIESHLGATYHFNTTGPDTFDCSGLVWRAFNDIGVNFQRGPARSYWATMEAPPKDEQFKFGTLVFFSGLSHVGIVADEKGFYHSSRHNGVIYSPFNDYWLSRIDGFRRVPMEGAQTVAVEKNRQAKPAAATQTSEEGTPR